MTEEKAIVPIKDGALAPADMEGLWRLATVMTKSGMFPSYTNQPEKMFVAIQMGMEVGLTITQAPQNIAVVNGKPSIYGDATTALVRPYAENEEEYFLLEEKKYEHYNGPEDLSEWPRELTAVCIIKRKGGSIYKGFFSVADAIRMGKWNKKTERGNESVWQKHPKDMLMWRARHKAYQKGFSDILKGLVPIEISRDYDADMVEDNGTYVESQTCENDSTPHALSKASGIPLVDVVAYISEICEQTGMSENTVVSGALGDVKEFKLMFEKWALKLDKKSDNDSKNPKHDDEQERTQGVINDADSKEDDEHQDNSQNASEDDSPGEPKNTEIDDKMSEIQDLLESYISENDKAPNIENPSEKLKKYIEYISNITKRTTIEVLDRAIGSNEFFKFFFSWAAQNETVAKSSEQENHEAQKKETPRENVSTSKNHKYSEFVRSFINLPAPRFALFVAQNADRFRSCPDEDLEGAKAKWGRLASQGKLNEEFPLSEMEDEPPQEGTSVKMRLSVLKKKYPDIWEKVRVKNGFAKIVSSEEAMIIWESGIHEELEGTKK